MIYIFDDIQGFSYEEGERLLPLLSGQRREKYDRYRFYKDKRLSELVYLLLRYGLLAERGITSPPELVTAPGGKPSVAGESFGISLSHCSAGVMSSITEGASGVDIQETVRSFRDIAGAVLTDEELAEIETREDSCERFTDIWTRKECCGKYSGEGIAYQMNRTALLGDNGKWLRFGEKFIFTGRGEGYSYSVCADSPQTIIRVSCESLIMEMDELFIYT